MHANNIYRIEHNHLQAVQLIGLPLKVKYHYTAKNIRLKLPATVVSTTIQIGYINLHVIEVTLLGNFN